MPKISRAMRERHSVDPRVLQLKIRLRFPKGATREVILAAVERAAETGEAPLWAARLPATADWRAGEWVAWIDWQKGEGASANAGRLTVEAQQELRAFYLALTHPATRLRVERAQD
jgi:hypothetical protein